jgi:adenosylcobinamide-GDP ribazoletransferase
MQQALKAVIFSIQFLTRIPVRYACDPARVNVRLALICFPSVGFIIGFALYVSWYFLNSFMRLHEFTAAVIIVALETIITGAFHLDGLADTFDALLSPGTTAEQKLSIMKDSRIGVMGAVALTLSLLLKSVLIAEILGHHHPEVLMLYPLVGRWTLVWFLFISPYLRASGIASILAQNTDGKTVSGASLWLMLCIVILPSFLPAFLVLLAILLLYRAYVHKQLGGITGDVLGAALIISEVVILFLLTILTR